MKTTIKITIIVIAAALSVKVAVALKSTYSGLQQRYVTEAKGKALGFISSQMY